ncbi:MAG: hypothetical protein WAM14_00230 [Candidatus Nitrosopolaris sp.]
MVNCYEGPLASHKKSLASHEELNDMVGMARDYGNIGLVFGDIGNNHIDYHNGVSFQRSNSDRAI